MGLAMNEKVAILNIVSFDPPTPTTPDSEDWALAVARELRTLYRVHGRVPILVWPDEDAPRVSLVGRRMVVDIKNQVVVNSP